MRILHMPHRNSMLKQWDQYTLDPSWLSTKARHDVAAIGKTRLATWQSLINVLACYHIGEVAKYSSNGESKAHA
jgi:hypothetical protein